MLAHLNLATACEMYFSTPMFVPKCSLSECSSLAHVGTLHNGPLPLSDSSLVPSTVWLDLA